MRLRHVLEIAAVGFLTVGSLFAWAQLPSPTFQGLQVLGLTQLGASTTSAAGLNIAPGVAPSSPNNGDTWTTSAGMFVRINGVTVGPLASGSTPCGTCATTTNGGPLSAVGPLAVSAGGQFTLGTQPFAAGYAWDSTATVPVFSYPVIEPWPYTNSGTISSVTYHTGGSGSPSFTFSLQINGTNITGCNAIVVNSGTDATTTCSGLNTIAAGQRLNLNITAITGTPNAAWVQINGQRPGS